MARRWALMAATPAALAGLAIGTSFAFGASSAGKPVAHNYLLCGIYVPGNESNFAGASDTDHPNGSTKSGMTYNYTNQNCENPGSSTGTFSWTITHSMVHTSGGNAETGVEHVQFSMEITGNRTSGAQGHITNFDLSTADSAGDPCPPPASGSSPSRVIFYASGHFQDKLNSCSPSSVGNFNTHGGAQTGDHFRGNYGTVVYQDNNNDACKVNNSNMDMCFAALLEGQTN